MDLDSLSSRSYQNRVVLCCFIILLLVLTCGRKEGPQRVLHERQRQSFRECRCHCAASVAVGFGFEAGLCYCSQSLLRAPTIHLWMPLSPKRRFGKTSAVRQSIPHTFSSICRNRIQNRNLFCSGFYPMAPKESCRNRIRRSPCPTLPRSQKILLKFFRSTLFLLSVLGY